MEQVWKEKRSESKQSISTDASEVMRSGREVAIRTQTEQTGVLLLGTYRGKGNEILYEL